MADLLTAEGTPRDNPATAFLLANGENSQPRPNKIAGSAAGLFWGVNLRCAECHKHPFAQWKQSDFWGTAAFFGKVQYGGGKGVPPSLMESLASTGSTKEKGQAAPMLRGAAIVIPATSGKAAGQVVKARFLGGDEPALDETPEAFMPRPLSRRRFLQATAAAGAAGFLTGQGRAGEKAPVPQKLLMLDPKALQSRRNVELRMQRPVRHPDNPLMRPEKPWEFGFLYIMTAQHDPKTDRWRMWYAGTQTVETAEQVVHRLCLAESKDGLRWERPNLGLTDFRGSREKNLLGADPGPVLFDAQIGNPAGKLHRERLLFAGRSEMDPVQAEPGCQGHR